MRDDQAQQANITIISRSNPVQCQLLVGRDASLETQFLSGGMPLPKIQNSQRAPQIFQENRLCQHRTLFRLTGNRWRIR
jgi:hypothetical protein